MDSSDSPAVLYAPEGLTESRITLLVGEQVQCFGSLIMAASRLAMSHDWMVDLMILFRGVKIFFFADLEMISKVKV